MNCMRTTVEITDSQRARLLRIAGERGEKGFSRLVQEALDHYLDEYALKRERIQAALSASGSIDDTTAEEMEASWRKSRESWR